MKQDKCKVCGSLLEKPFFSSSSDTSLTTMNELLEGKTYVFLCNNCSHLQTNEIENVKTFYQQDYEINLNNEDEDQLYEVIDGKNIYRTEKQAEMVLKYLEINESTKIMDYGCAKSSTTKFLSEKFKFRPYLFDVTDKYTEFWEKFTDLDKCSSVNFPSQKWTNKFDVVVSFYALEHVVDLEEALTNIHNSLKIGGKFFFMVPNVYKNAADFIVADHVNHFSRESIEHLLSKFGYDKVMIDEDSFNAAFVVTAIKINTKRVINPQSPSSKNLEILNNYKELWSDLGARLNDFLHNIPPEEEFSIYGSGFYGSYIFSCLEKRKPKFFLDRNSKKDQSLFGIPVIKPSDNPVNINYIFVALNPNVASEAIKGANIKDIQKKNLFYI